MSAQSLGIAQAAALVSTGELTSEQLVGDCLKRIEEFEPAVQAWAWCEPKSALEQASACDAVRRRNRGTGRLHGVPVGIKDIIDVRLTPTEWGTPLYSGRIAAEDAFLVQKLREEGAVIMGKTVSTEFATFSPGKTRNPHNGNHTPGGSSSGSAAAVAAFMVPGAVGSQTNGSVIRPASFCGVYGFKPTFGTISCHGVLTQSPFLDQMGVFARSLEDAALLAEVLAGRHPDSPGIEMPCPRPQLVRTCAEEPPMPPRLAYVSTARHDRADAQTLEGFEQLVEALGERIDRISLPPAFDSVWDLLSEVNYAEMAYHYGPLIGNRLDQVSDSLRGQMQSGLEINATRYLGAMAKRKHLNVQLNELFGVYDALVTPATTGEAPAGLDSTGDPVFCTPWTFCGVPALTLPLLEGENGLPVGVQVVGRFGDDGRLLRSARWLENQIKGE